MLFSGKHILSLRDFSLCAGMKKQKKIEIRLYMPQCQHNTHQGLFSLLLEIHKQYITIPRQKGRIYSWVSTMPVWSSEDEKESAAWRFSD